MAETVNTLCPDCAQDDHHACVGAPECPCSCADFAECEECDGRGYVGVFSATHGAPCPSCSATPGATS